METSQQAFAQVFFGVTDDIPAHITLKRIEHEALKSHSIGLLMALESLCEIDFGDFVVTENATIGELRELAKKLSIYTSVH